MRERSVFNTQPLPAAFTYAITKCVSSALPWVRASTVRNCSFVRPAPCRPKTSGIGRAPSYACGNETIVFGTFVVLGRPPLPQPMLGTAPDVVPPAPPGIPPLPATPPAPLPEPPPAEAPAPPAVPPLPDV